MDWRKSKVGFYCDSQKVTEFDIPAKCVGYWQIGPKLKNEPKIILGFFKEGLFLTKLNKVLSIWGVISNINGIPEFYHTEEEPTYWTIISLPNKKEK